jgi:hypothetical protein
VKRENNRHGRKFTSAAGLVPETTLPSPDKYLLTDINEQDQMIKSNMDIIRHKLLEMFEFDFNVYAIFSPNSEISCEKQVAVEGTPKLVAVAETSERFINTNDWCPIFIQTVAESGRTIRLDDESYEDYFKAFQGWKYYFMPESLTSTTLRVSILENGK